MSWQKMRIPAAGAGENLPGDRGRYLLWLEPPHVQGDGHYVHFSWKGDAFCLRDYVGQVERRQDAETRALDIWKAATGRIPAKGEFHVPFENFEFWTAKLTELTESRQRGAPPSLWSRLSSKFISSTMKNDEHSTDSAGQVSASASGDSSPSGAGGNATEINDRFKSLWKASPGFDVVEGTVGCSARFRDEPLLWVYPTRFQIAPEGKGNAHYRTVRDLVDKYFPGSRNDTIRFASEHFTGDRFQRFVTELKQIAATWNNRRSGRRND
jgi:hypothetical protein